MSDHEEIVDGLLGRIPTDLGQRAGKVLYSGTATVSPGSLYLMGVNPGGNPDQEPQTIIEHTSRLTEWGNEYLDAVWAPGGRPCQPGMAPVQRRATDLLKSLGENPRHVCSSNLVFVRSTREKEALNPSLIEQCLPVHEFILSRVQPSAILTFSRHAYAQIKNLSDQQGDEEIVASGHGNRSHACCYHSDVSLFDRPVSLFRIPHFTYYNPTNYPEVIAWLHSRI